jgi:hypothetical protein
VTPDGERHAERLRVAGSEIRRRINTFTNATFRCRGGRLGSGMGSLLEALWGFYAREVLDETSPEQYDIAWVVNHGYNDFALVAADGTWDSTTGHGALLGIEAKSMNLGTKESKAHFDALVSEIEEDDLLLVLVWRWSALEAQVVYPEIVGEFVGPAREVAELRDRLHVARGGSFVAPGGCPDCDALYCPHVGEPLNSRGTRERRTGPPSTRGRTAPNAANFGGLVRMLSVRSQRARNVLDQQRGFPVRREYHDFVRSFPTLFQS